MIYMSKAPIHVIASCARLWLTSICSAPKHEYDVGVEPGEYMLGVRGGCLQTSFFVRPPGHAGDGLTVCVAP